MQRESLHCGELIKRLNDILGRCANEELRADDMTSSQVKMLMIINETKDDKGRAMCVHAGKAMHDKEKWFLSSLSADEKEELHSLLQKVYDDVNNCERKCKKC